MKKLRKQDMSWSTSSSDRLQCFDVGGAQKAQRLRIRHSTGVPKQTISMAINILFLQCPSVSFAQHSRSTLQVVRLQAIAKYPTRSKNSPTSISRSAPRLVCGSLCLFPCLPGCHRRRRRAPRCGDHKARKPEDHDDECLGTLVCRL